MGTVHHDKDVLNVAVKLVLKSSESAPFRVFAFEVEGAEARKLYEADEEHKVDIVLVHGLTGDPLKTWGGRLHAEGRVSECWPERLARDLDSSARIWTIGYKAPLFDAQIEAVSRSELDEADSVLNAMVGAGLGRRRIIFVAHSLGGLLVKAFLWRSHESGDDEKQSIVKHTCAVCFLGTPHCGSHHAIWRILVPPVLDWAAKGWGIIALALLSASGLAGGLSVPTLFASGPLFTAAGVVAGLLVPVIAFALKGAMRSGRHVVRLDPNNALLHNLANGYRKVVWKHSISTYAFYENKRTWKFFMVVPRPSADPGVTDCTPREIEASHIEMCKLPAVQEAISVIQARVRHARLGRDDAVFRDTLLGLKEDLEPYSNAKALVEARDVKKFKEFEVKDEERRKRSDELRVFLWKVIVSGKLAPARDELERCSGSDFDLDKFVWDVWHENVLADKLRALRTKANGVRGRWNSEFMEAMRAQSDPPPSLISFYRTMRTIEHTLIGDLVESGSTPDRDVLLRVIETASKELEYFCPTMKWKLRNANKDYKMDQGGETRYLLSRMRCAVLATKAAADFIGNPSGHEDADRHGRELAAKLARFETALSSFRTTLGLSQCDNGPSAKGGLGARVDPSWLGGREQATP